MVGPSTERRVGRTATEAWPRAEAAWSRGVRPCRCGAAARCALVRCSTRAGRSLVARACRARLLAAHVAERASPLLLLVVGGTLSDSSAPQRPHPLGRPLVRADRRGRLRPRRRRADGTPPVRLRLLPALPRARAGGRRRHRPGRAARRPGDQRGLLPRRGRRHLPGRQPCCTTPAPASCWSPVVRVPVARSSAPWPTPRRSSPPSPPGACSRPRPSVAVAAVARRPRRPDPAHGSGRRGSSRGRRAHSAARPAPCASR